MLRELFEQNRSYRRFYEDRTIKTEVLEGLLANARIANSAGNKQPLKYIISNNRKINEKIFLTLSWAAYFKDWEGPERGERPQPT